MSAQPSRRILLRLAFALGTLVTVGSLALIGLIAVAVRSNSPASPQAPSRDHSPASAPIAAPPLLESVSNATAPARAPLDPDAEAVHRAWVEAMLAGDEAAATALFAAADPEARSEAVLSYIANTALWRSLAELSGTRGRFSGRFELIGGQPGADTSRIVGLSLLHFERGAKCFATFMVRAGDKWRVEQWEPAFDYDCDRSAEEVSANLQAPAAPVTTTAAFATHEIWSDAMFAGDPGSAAALYASEDAETASKRTLAYAELTRYVVGANTSELGAFLRPVALGTYAVSEAHHVGLTRAVYERGSLCFRSDLVPGSEGWQVTTWDFVEHTECEELAGR